MKYRKLDANGDYCLGGGTTDFVTDVYATALAIKTKLALLQGEWFENLQEGLPLFQSILGVPGGLKSAVDLLYQERIVSVPSVKNIQNIQSSLANRNYSFYCVINTDFGFLRLANFPDPSGSTVARMILIDESNDYILVDEGNGSVLTS